MNRIPKSKAKSGSSVPKHAMNHVCKSVNPENTDRTAPGHMPIFTSTISYPIYYCIPKLVFKDSKCP